MQANEFASNVAQWAEDRNLVEGSSPDAQIKKLLEESTELYEGLRLGKAVEIKDGVGDVEVVLRVIECQLGLEFMESTVPLVIVGCGDAYSVYLSTVARLVGRVRRGRSPRFIQDAIIDARGALRLLVEGNQLTIDQCRAHAWNEIKDRKGRMVDGVFVKEVA
jgi:hypothetical protein